MLIARGFPRSGFACAWIVLLAASCDRGCTSEPALTPPGSSPFDVVYLGDLRLDRTEAKKQMLNTRATLVVTPRTRPLSRLDLWPGLDDLGIRPTTGPDEWDWELATVDSDRPVRLEVDAWRLTVHALTPVPVGMTWVLRLEYGTRIGRLKRAPLGDDLLPKAGAAPAEALEALLDVGEAVLTRFASDVSSNSFSQDDLFVLLPPWPLIYDCGGRPPASAFPPRDCVARRDLPVQVRVEVPAGFEAVLPTPARFEAPVGGPRQAVVDRLPEVILLSPKLIWRKIEVGSRRVSLCTPSDRGDDLDELARLVGWALPALESVLGPYPHADPIICLCPTPSELWGLARGRLALIDVQTFASLTGDTEMRPAIVRRLESWIATDAFFQSLRAELVLHELAHHWWRVVLPDRWDRLLSEGFANLVAREMELGKVTDARQRYFAEASPWLEAAQLELAGIKLSPLSAYLAEGDPVDRPDEGVLPYLHGLALVERLFGDGQGGVRWAAVRAVHERSGPAFRPEDILDSVARARLQEVIASDQHLDALSRVDPVEHCLRSLEGLVAALDRTFGGRLASIERLARGPLRLSLVARLTEMLGLGDADVDVLSAVLRLAGVTGCDPPATEGERRRCVVAFEQEGLPMLAQLIQAASPRGWLEVAKDASSPELDLDDLGRLAIPVLDRSLDVADDEAIVLSSKLPMPEARAQLLLARLQARWAARAALELIDQSSHRRR